MNKPETTPPTYFHHIRDGTTIHYTGVESTRVRNCGRRLREDGIFSKSTKSRIPQSEAIHAAVLICTSMVDRHQLHAVEALRNIWNLPYYTPDHTFLVPANELAPWAGTFGQAVTAIIDSYARGEFIEDDGVSRVSIMQGAAYAEIVQAERYHIYRAVDLRLQPRKRADHCYTMGIIPFISLKWLGELVALSRRQAAKLGVEIETASTLRALEPPPENGPENITSGRNRLETQNSNDESSNGTPRHSDEPSSLKTKTAASDPARGQNAAALSDQPAQTELDRHGQPYPTWAGHSLQHRSGSDARLDKCGHGDNGRPDRRLGASPRRAA